MTAQVMPLALLVLIIPFPARLRSILQPPILPSLPIFPCPFRMTTIPAVRESAVIIMFLIPRPAGRNLGSPGPAILLSR